MLVARDYESFGDDVTESDVREWREAATRDEPGVHVKIAPRGCWHRMTVDRTRTACGKLLGAYATRDESYAGDLCQDGCFTTYELELAAKAIEDERERERLEQEQQEQREAARSEQRARDFEAIREERRRIDIATGRHPKLEPDEPDDGD